MDGFTVSGELKGLDDVLAQLNGLSQGMRNRHLKPAILKGCRVIAKAVKSLITPSGVRYIRKTVGDDGTVSEKQVVGQLKKSIGSTIGVESDGTVLGRVGARRGFRVLGGVRVRGPKKGQPIYHSPSRIVHLVELGHGGVNPAPPHPFLRPGFDVSKAQAVSVIAESIRDSLAKERGKQLLAG